MKNDFDSKIDHFVSKLNDACDKHTEEWYITFDYYVNGVTSQFIQAHEVLANLRDSVSALEDIAVSINVKSIDNFNQYP